MHTKALIVSGTGNGIRSCTHVLLHPCNIVCNMLDSFLSPLANG